LFVLGFGIVMVATRMNEGLVVSAQNANSSTTMANTNESKPKPKPRRGRRTKKPAATEATATEATATEAAAMPTETPAPRKTGRCDPTQQEQADLSGTYTGTINYADAGLTGDATLTVTGNNFTLTAGSATQSGRITAVTTCGYTGATMMFGDLTPQAPSPHPPPALPAVSVRAKQVGDHMTLMPVPGEKRSFSFSSGGATMRPRKHTRAKKAGAAPPQPAATPPQQ